MSTATEQAQAYDQQQLEENLAAIARHLRHNPTSPLTLELFERWADRQLTPLTAPEVMAIPGVVGDYLEHYLGCWPTLADAIAESVDDEAPQWLREQVGGNGSEEVAERLSDTGWVTTVWTEGNVHVWQTIGHWPQDLPYDEEIARYY